MNTLVLPCKLQQYPMQNKEFPTAAEEYKEGEITLFSKKMMDV